jgi:hypothetical protein
MAACAAMHAATAGAQSVIPQSVLAAGGSVAEGVGYAVRATVGQPVIGVVGGTTRVASQGYWFNPYVIVSGTNDPPAALRPFSLEQNYPNPFNPTTTITFYLPEDARVRLRLFDVSGAAVRELVDGSMPSGTHKVTLDAHRLASGVYFCRLEAGQFQQTRKLTILK